MGFAVQEKSKFSGGKDKNVVCNNCNRPGHKSDGCFKLISYPKWWGVNLKELDEGLDMATKCNMGLEIKDVEWVKRMPCKRWDQE